MKKSIIDLTEMFPNDNLSDYQKENGSLLLKLVLLMVLLLVMIFR